MADYMRDLRKVVGTRPIIMGGAGVLLLDAEDRVLLQLRADNGCWGITGGAMELGETFEQTARREVLEETGLTVGELEVLCLHSGSQTHYVYPHGDEVYLAAVIFTSRDYHGEMHADETETSALKWFAVGDLPDNLNQPDRHAIAQLVVKMRS